MESRLRRIERSFGGRDDCGPLVVICPNAWSDVDRDLWERSEILHDDTLHDDLIERYTGHRPRPCRAHCPHVNLIVVPAPAAVEEASEDERAAWRDRVSARHPWRS
jgi:hypothetical protein